MDLGRSFQTKFCVSCISFVIIFLLFGCGGSGGGSGSDSCEALEHWAASDLCSSFDPQALADKLRSEDAEWFDIPTSITQDIALTEDDKAFLKLAVKAYVWGYAPMTIYRLEQEKTNSQAPQNHFYHPTHVANWQLPSPVSAPNMDVLYSSAFLDLSQGPLIFTMHRG